MSGSGHTSIWINDMELLRSIESMSFVANSIRSYAHDSEIFVLSHLYPRQQTQ